LNNSTTTPIRTDIVIESTNFGVRTIGFMTLNSDPGGTARPLNSNELSTSIQASTGTTLNALLNVNTTLNTLTTTIGR